ncbi:hypothetical protein NDU88_005177 [Pleurodeles waltl]|uniref:Uncharacterized protein n=1 Tax=Pleurodeles waltl TaxID=8319 RepID=A0AAV7QE91_PLEWA|nr:hypothetical protein NDU88_005177 [Pleurodeles waltl]
MNRRRTPGSPLKCHHQRKHPGSESIQADHPPLTRWFSPTTIRIAIWFLRQRWAQRPEAVSAAQGKIFTSVPVTGCLARWRPYCQGRGTWRPVEALTANSHRTRDADERRDLRPLTWKRRAESRSSPAVGSTRERITAAVEGPPCCDEEEVWRRDAGEETRGETGIVQGS